MYMLIISLSISSGHVDSKGLFYVRLITTEIFIILKSVSDSRREAADASRGTADGGRGAADAVRGTTNAERGESGDLR
jgi:hypothetical protein